MQQRDPYLETTDWQEGFEDDVYKTLDMEMKNENNRQNPGHARSRIEELREQKYLDDMLYDVFDDDALN